MTEQRPPVLRDHVFLWPMGWSFNMFKSGSIVLVLFALQEVTVCAMF